MAPLGFAHQQLGDLAEAIRCCRRAIELHLGGRDQTLRKPHVEPHRRAPLSQGETRQAGNAWQRALGVRRGARAAAEEVRRKLVRPAARSAYQAPWESAMA
ncbi:tetratricopeptide repeat protein [Amycolatopsis taiwanensis]|uniref:tetratricopeptide repeat protein n=1 Tax=Amycolatopsis taiwanensis TaxID=342230 RepID=UPI003D7F5546